MSNLWQRLKQRKIVQWAIAYAAGAWLSLEVFDLVAEQFFLPVWLRQGATVLFLFGLLVTIVLAWYHGERGQQRVGLVESVLLIVLMVLGGTTVWFVRDRSLVRTAETDVDGPAFRVTPPENSVAVLPCLNLNPDNSQAYFADAMAAELITRLSAIKGLRIPSHTSSFAFKDRNVTIEVVASALKVRHVLECDVSGDDSNIKVNARLIEADSGYTLWSDSYDRRRASLFDVQREVALAVVQALEVRLPGRERLLVNRRWTESAEAYEQFLQGIRFQLSIPTDENFAGARRHLERAVELDPDFGRAFARLAVQWVVAGNFSLVPPREAYAEVERLAERAIELDGELFEAYWARGWAKFAGDYDWQGAARDFRRAIDLAPGEWGGYHSLGFVLGVLGQFTEAMDAARMAIDLDPLAFWPYRGLEILLIRQRNYEAAISVLVKQAELQGWAPEIRARYAWLLALTGREAQARVQLARITEEAPSNPALPYWRGSVFLALGELEEAQRIAGEPGQQQEPEASRMPASYLAALYAETGDSERALYWLVKSREIGDIIILFLDSPSFDNLRGDPRFADFIRDLGLPEHVYIETAKVGA